MSKCPDCPRQLFDEVSVDKHWLKKETEKDEEAAKNAKSKEKSDQEIGTMFSKVDSGKVSLDVPEDVFVKLPDEMADDVFSSPVPFSVLE